MRKLIEAAAASGPEAAPGAATASGEASAGVEASSGSDSAARVLLQPLGTFLRPLRGRRLLRAREWVDRYKEGADVDRHSRVGVLGRMHWIRAPHDCKSIFDVVVCHLGARFSGAQLTKVESGAGAHTRSMADIFNDASLRVYAGEDGCLEGGVPQVADVVIIGTASLLPVSWKGREDELLGRWRATEKWDTSLDSFGEHIRGGSHKLTIHVICTRAVAADGNDAVVCHSAKRSTIKTGVDDGSNMRRVAQ
jgi:hypothetical protein